MNKKNPIMNSNFKLSTILILCTVIIGNTAADGSKVKVDVYYETLCGDSIRFITTQLVPNYQSLESIIDVQLVPFGKAMSDQGKFICQHGPTECRGNVFQACALHQSSANFSRSLAFVDCMEKTVRPNAEPDIDSIACVCAQICKLDNESMDSCASGTEGTNLMLEMETKTKSVKPKIVYVPTIVLNGNPSKNAQTNFVHEVCLEYKGTNIPNVCSKEQQENSTAGSSTTESSTTESSTTDTSTTETSTTDTSTTETSTTETSTTETPTTETSTTKTGSST